MPLCVSQAEARENGDFERSKLPMIAKDSRSNKETIKGRLLRLEGIIPLAMKSIPDGSNGFPFFVGDFDASRIRIAIFDGDDLESLISGGVRNQFNDRLQAVQWFATPIDGNVGKEPMFDFVPLAGSWWKMTHGDGEPRLVGQALQFALPQTETGSVASASISGDQQIGCVWVEGLAYLLPPASYTLHRKRSGIMVNPHVDKTLIVHHIVDPVGNGFSISQ